MQELTPHQAAVMSELEKNGGNKQATADSMGISRSSVRRAVDVATKKMQSSKPRMIQGNRPSTSNVLVIGDTHCPAMLDGYVEFLQSIQERYNCDRVVHIGDLVDWASISYHPKAPSLRDADREFSKAMAQVQTLYKAFPKADWLIGNHDSLSERQAVGVGLPKAILKDYAELWEISGWNVIPRFDSIEIDGTIYQHGDRGRGGQINSAYLNAQDEHRSVVQGHFHAQAGVLYMANKRSRFFGLQTGCGIDHHTAAMEYGFKFNRKPIVGCGVVLGGVVGLFEPMEI